MSKSITIENTLDAHLRPLKIDDKTTGIEISDDEIAIRNEAFFDQNLTAKSLSSEEGLSLKGRSPVVDFGNQQKLLVQPSDNNFRFSGNILELYSFLIPEFEEINSIIRIMPQDADAVLQFWEGVATKWSIGHDFTDLGTFKFCTGTTLGTNTKFQIGDDGDVLINSTNGGTDLKLTSSANTSDYCSITVGAEGATTIATVDADTEAADLTLDVDGDITLDADGSQVYFSNNGSLAAQISTANGRITQYGTSGSTDDFSTISCATNGAMTIATTDAAGANADFTLNVDGDITLNSVTGVFITQNNGTEFSVAKSSYAGMILGYQLIGESAVHGSYTFTTSYAVPNSDMNVKFVAPPSGAVEITVQFGIDGTSGRYNYVGLSDNATYNSIGNSYEVSLNFTDETDQNTIQHMWVVTGLTAGTAYQYWLGAKSTHASGYIRWGGTATGRYQDFIMKAVALPAAVADYAVYD